MDGNQNEWCILYHGTKMLHFAAHIIVGGFNPGQRNAFELTQCVRTGKIIGAGIYFTNHMEVTEKYAFPIQV